MKSNKRKIESHDSNPAKKPKYEDVSDNAHSQEESMKKSSSCMKHKKKDKSSKDDKKKYKKSKKHKNKSDDERRVEDTLKVSIALEKVDPDKIHIPQAAEEISMNWRDMLKQMAATKKPVQKQDQNPEHKKKWKLRFRTIDTQNPGQRIHWQKNHHKRPEETVKRPGKTVKKDEPVNSSGPDVCFDGVDSSGPAVWFDGVDSVLLEHHRKKTVPIDSKGNPLVKENSFSGLTHLIAMDCEMVGVGDRGQASILARISMVNHFGHCIYDKYVKPTEKVTDYRTWVSGIRPSDIADGEEFKVVQAEVNDMLKGRVLVGHAVHHDMDVLFLKHPKKMIRDTSQYSYFRSLVGGGTPSLKKLSERVLGIRIQDGEHSSVTDAQATMRLYTMHRKAWEKELKNKEKS